MHYQASTCLVQQWNLLRSTSQPYFLQQHPAAQVHMKTELPSVVNVYHLTPADSPKYVCTSSTLPNNIETCETYYCTMICCWKNSTSSLLCLSKNLSLLTSMKSTPLSQRPTHSSHLHLLARLGQGYRRLNQMTSHLHQALTYPASKTPHQPLGPLWPMAENMSRLHGLGQQKIHIITDYFSKYPFIFKLP